jgi:hypothetical protein
MQPAIINGNRKIQQAKYAATPTKPDSLAQTKRIIAPTIKYLSK